MTYNEIRARVLRAIRELDASQLDAHVWAWLDHEACNANELRFAIIDALGAIK